jgi:hypothetical protein
MNPKGGRKPPPSRTPPMGALLFNRQRFNFLTLIFLNEPLAACAL